MKTVYFVLILSVQTSTCLHNTINNILAFFRQLHGFEIIANECVMHYIIYHISGVFKNKIFRAYSRESLLYIAYKLADSKLTPHLRLPENCDIVLDRGIEVSCRNISPVSQHVKIKE